METITKVTTLGNSWETFNTSNITNSIDLSCVSPYDSSIVSIDGTPVMFLTGGQRDQIDGHNVGYLKEYRVESTGSGSTYCTIREYTSSVPLNFTVNGDLYFLFMLGFYLLFFSIGLRLSFFR